MNYNLRDMLYHLKSKDFIKYNGIEKFNESEEYIKSNLHEAIKENVEFFSHHSKLYKNQDILFQISMSSFSNLKLDLDDLIEIQNRFNKSSVGLYGKEYDNSAYIMLSDIFGRLFKAYVSKDRSGYNLNVWDTSGSISLLSIQTKNKELNKDEINQLNNAWDLLMKHIEDQKRSRERYHEIKRYSDYIKIEHTKIGYASSNYRVVVSNEIPIELSDEEIAKYCDGWNYCFGGRCSLIKNDNGKKVYDVTVYTD